MTGRSGIEKGGKICSKRPQAGFKPEPLWEETLSYLLRPQIGPFMTLL